MSAILSMITLYPQRCNANRFQSKNIYTTLKPIALILYILPSPDVLFPRRSFAAMDIGLEIASVLPAV